MADLLAIDRVTAGYGDTTVIEAVSLAVAAGETVAVLGRNGVGKTTLLATVMGLTAFRGGRISFRGAAVEAMATQHRARLGIGYVPQEREIFPSLTVLENLRVARRAGEWDPERAFALFPRLAERRRHHGNQLSGGEQQMLAMARALVSNPGILLLDEPFEGLAPVVVDTLAEALARLREETDIAILLVEQQVDLALDLASRAVVLDRGRVAWSGASRALARDAATLASLVGLGPEEAGPGGAAAAAGGGRD